MKYQSIYNRLRRIEGQIRGLSEMVAQDRTEAEILIQLQAAKSALASTISSLIKSRLKDRGGNLELSESEIDLILDLFK